jgi:hypothetical protein
MDSQTPTILSSSPFSRRDVRRIAPKRAPVFGRPTPHKRGSFEEVTREVTTKVTTIRESRARNDTGEVRCYPLQTNKSTLNDPIVDDSQEKEIKFAGSPSDSSLTDMDPVFNNLGDGYLVALDRQRNKKRQGEEAATGRDANAVPQITDQKTLKSQTKKPLKSCLKQTAQRKISADQSELGNLAVKTPVLDSLRMNPPTSLHGPRTRLASLVNSQDSIKQPPSNNSVDTGKISSSLKSTSSTPSVKPESSAPQRVLRKRSISSVLGGPKSELNSEPPAKQARLSLPGRSFQAIPPFFSTA